jgi:hypothetical protein
MEEVISRKYQSLKAELNERQRRLWAASEAQSLGHGGISLVSRATGLSRPTITKGIKELKNGERLPEGRVRRKGGGPKKHTNTQPKLSAALDALVEPTAKGDPMSPLRWTTKSTRRLAETLRAQKFNVSKSLVCQLLHEAGYQLSANRKSLEGGTNGGGSNGSRNRLWKYCLQEFADETGLTIHVSHFPPGTSKWNKIEHRLFNHISMNWKGQPLVSLDVIINLIGNTTSRKGLKVYAMKDDNKYPTKRKIPDYEMEKINILRNEILGKWNYIIKPRKQCS